jgi:cytochrome c biogenesis protein CcdA
MKLVKFPTLLLIAFFSLLGAGAQSRQELQFDPPEWKYGMITAGETATASVAVKNLTNNHINVEFVSTCSCLTVSPRSASIEGGSSARFKLAYDSTKDEGKVRRYFIVTTDPPAEKPIFYILSGVVRVDNAAASAKAGAAVASAVEALASAPGSLELRYYYAPGCRSCGEFLSSGIPDLESRYGVVAKVERRDILESAAYEELAAFAASIGDSIRAMPALRVGGILLQGDKEIEDRLPGIFAAAVPGGAGGAGQGGAGQGGAGPSAAPAPAGSRAGGISVLAVAAAGLADGINPCAFTTLLFLLSSLALAGRGRREVLAIGLVFSLGVFLTYLGAGLGLFAALRAASSVALVSAILRWVLVAVLAVLAVLSLVDYAKIRAGKPGEMLLQLPNAIKLKIHSTIRVRARADHPSAARTAALAGSSLVLGFLVSIFEFACTGQVYLPTLAYLARGPGGSRAAALLVLYNLCFIAPLLVVFGAAFFGVGSKRITSLFQRRMGATKIALALVFAALAALTALT